MCHTLQSRVKSVEWHKYNLHALVLLAVVQRGAVFRELTVNLQNFEGFF